MVAIDFICLIYIVGGAITGLAMVLIDRYEQTAHKAQKGGK